MQGPELLRLPGDGGLNGEVTGAATAKGRQHDNASGRYHADIASRSYCRRESLGSAVIRETVNAGAALVATKQMGCGGCKIRAVGGTEGEFEGI